MERETDMDTTARRVLVVEDEADIAHLLALHLRDGGDFVGQAGLLVQEVEGIEELEVGTPLTHMRLALEMLLPDKADAALIEAQDIWTGTLGPDHPDTVETIGSLAIVTKYLGRFVEAAPLYEETLAGRTRLLGAEHPRTLATQYGLADLYWSMRRTDDAERLLLATIDSQQRVLGPGRAPQQDEDQPHGGEPFPPHPVDQHHAAEKHRPQGADAPIHIQARGLSDRHPEQLHHEEGADDRHDDAHAGQQPHVGEATEAADRGDHEGQAGREPAGEHQGVEALGGARGRDRGAAHVFEGAERQ